MCRRVRSAHGRPSAKNWRSRKSCGIVRKTRNPSARAPLSNVQHPRNRPEKTLRRPRGAPPGGRSRPDPAGGGMSAVRVVARWTEARTPRAGGGMARTLEAGERTSALAPAGGAAVGRDMQDVVPESRRVPAAAAAGRDVRDVVDDGADAGEQGEWSGHADRGADARESVMLVTESFRRLPRGTRRKPPSALVAEGATTTTCCGRG